MAFIEIPTAADLVAIGRIHDRMHELVKIDKHALDDELATQAEKYRDVLDGLTMTISYLAAAKDNFDQIEAELLQAVHAEHERKYAGVDKTPRLTDTAARAQATTDADWIKAKQLRRDWENMHIKMQHLKDVFGQRSSNMKELPTLFAAGYWQGNSSDGRPRGERSAEHTRQELDRRREQSDTSTERRRPAGGR